MAVSESKIASDPVDVAELSFGGAAGVRVRAIDLTHRFSIHTPGWVGYPSPKLSYFQRHATNGIVSQMLELPLHSGTHFDGEMHIISGGKDIASVPMGKLLGEGVIVDISEEMHDWAVIEPGTPPPGRGSQGRHFALPHGLLPLLQRLRRGG